VGAQGRALAADGVSQREIAARLGLIGGWSRGWRREPLREAGARRLRSLSACHGRTYRDRLIGPQDGIAPARQSYLTTVSATLTVVLPLVSVRRSRAMSGRRLATAPSSLRSTCTRLTAREIQVLESVASGLSGREIASILGITYKTERNHVANILQKLQAHSLAHAVAVALGAGLIGPPPLV
jgi:DNA-binding CsgD family transcriptional regulator